MVTDNHHSIFCSFRLTSAAKSYQD